MNIKFYSGFSKRINSTKRPTGSAQLSLEGDLRDVTSVEHPVIKIKNMGQTSPTSYVYAYIQKFDRYYFVTDWVYDQGFWWVHLAEDYLATWKTYIGNTNAYIDRCASESDGDIVDVRYITTTNRQFAYNHLTMNPAYYMTDTSVGISGCFVIGILNSEDASASQVGGATTYYVLTPEQCKVMMNYLMSDDFLADIGFPSTMAVDQTMSQDMAKAFVNPLQFIVSCVWYPFSYEIFAYGVNPTMIKVGYWETTIGLCYGRIINRQNMANISVSGTLPDHPQSADRGQYLNYAPYSRYKLYVPPFGTIPIDASYRRLGNKLSGAIELDPITGQAKFIYTFYDSSVTPAPNAPWENVYVEEQTVMFGVPIQMAQVTNDIFHSTTEHTLGAMSALGSVGNFISLNPSGAISEAKEYISHMANAVDYLAPQVRTNGDNGSRLLTFNKPRIVAEFSPLVDEDNEEMGRPLRKKRVINTLSGYVKCFEVTVDYPCFATEKGTILNFLMTGFFWE